MKKIYYCFMALSSAALVSCSDDAPSTGNNSFTSGDNAVAFSTYVDRAATSRGAVTDYGTLQGLPSGIGVFASYTQGQAWAGGDQSANFMFNQQVGWNGSSWSYTPLKYWPGGKSEKVSFFAYAPYQSGVTSSKAESGIYEWRVSNGANSHKGLKAVYQVGTDVLNHQDLVLAQAVDQTSEDDPVQLKFKHALAKVGFKVYGWDEANGDKKTTVTINGISLTTELEIGMIDFTTGEWEFCGETGNTTSFILSGELLQNTTFTGADKQGVQVNSEDGYIMALPNFSYGGAFDPYTVVVDYTVTTVDNSLAEGSVSVRNKIYKGFRPNFQAGKAYTIALHLGLDGNGGGGGGDGPDYPDPVDPNPGEGGDPTPGGNGGSITLTATVSDWDDPSTETEVKF